MDEKRGLFGNTTPAALPPGLQTRIERKQVLAVAFSPDGTRLAAAGDGRIWVYDTASGAQFAMLSGYTEQIRAVAFAHDNSLLASGSADNTLRLWNTETAEELLTLAGDSHLTNALATSSPDGVPLPAWDPRTERLLAAAGEDPGRVRSLAFSGDDQTLATGSADGRVRLWEVDTGRLLSTFSAHDGLVLALTFTAGDTKLATGGTDTLVRLWNLADQHVLSIFRGHTDSVSALAFSPEGDILVSGGRDNYIQLWDATDGSPLATYPIQADAIQELFFSTDGEKLMCVTQDGTLLVRER